MSKVARRRCLRHGNGTWEAHLDVSFDAASSKSGIIKLGQLQNAAKNLCRCRLRSESTS